MNEATKWEKDAGREVSEDVFVRTLAETIRALEQRGIRYLLMGGLASTALGRPRYSRDIDLMVARDDARAVLDALAETGFETQETDPLWLFKAVKQDVLVDVIFVSRGGIYLDDEMLERSVETEFKGQRVRAMAAEDLLVIKALAHREENPRHWFDALGLIAPGDLDWRYVVFRARHGVRRVLSLLIYAQSEDLMVPNRVVRELFDLAFPFEQRS